MAMTIFFVLNGVGVVFLLYFLANFWKEGHEPIDEDREYTMEPLPGTRASVLVVTHPISLSAQGGLSVISFQAGKRALKSEQEKRYLVADRNEMPAKRESFSTK